VGHDDAVTTRLWSVVFDSVDPGAVGRWWSDALRWPVVHEGADEVAVWPPDGDEGVPGLVFVPVPEPKTGKNRIHLDLPSRSPEDQQATVDRLVGLGGRRVDVGQGDVPWVVLADPEGNELCVLEPRERYTDAGALAAVVLDVADPVRLARFWTAASGWALQEEGDGGVSLSRPGGRPPDLELLATPEPKTTKLRVHLDVAPFPDDDQRAEVERLVAAGARRVDVGQGPDVTWVVLADPEGNELCVLRPR
jgi:hypothetical protein